MAALGPGDGPDLEHVVGGADHGLVVLDDDDGVSGAGEGADDFDEAVDVARVQADGGLVEDEERVDERGAEAGGQAHAHGLAAGERLAGAVEGEVAEADLGQITQAGEDGLVGEGDGAVGGGAELGLGAPGDGDEVEQVGDGELVEVGEGFAAPLPAKGVGLEAGAGAVGAGVVGAEAGEEDADVGFVGVFFEPVEKALQAIPGVGPLAAGLAVVGLALEDEALVLGAEVGEGDVDGQADFFGEADQVFLRLAVGLALPGLDGAVGDGEGAVGDGEVGVDLDDAPETTAAWAGAEGGVEGKKRGGRGAEGAAGGGRVEAAGEVAGGDEGGGGRGEEVELALAEVHGLLGGFEETEAGVGV